MRVGRRGDEKRVARQRFKFQRRVARHAVVRPRVQNGKIQPAAEQAALHLIGRLLTDAHFDARMLPVERGQHPRQVRRRQIIGDAYGHAALSQRALFADFGFKRRVDAQHFAGHAVIFFARISQHQPAGSAREQPRAELLLDVHHAMAQRRLGDEQLLRGAGHAALVGNGLDIEQFSGGHAFTSSLNGEKWGKFSACRSVFRACGARLVSARQVGGGARLPVRRNSRRNLPGAA